jgi:hypothetical protein
MPVSDRQLFASPAPVADTRYISEEWLSCPERTVISTAYLFGGTGSNRLCNKKTISLCCD